MAEYTEVIKQFQRRGSMGRLIDADVLAGAIQRERNLLIERGQYGAEHILVHHFERIVEDVPTVDAIPVEWLENLQQESLNENDRTMVGAIEAIFIEWHIYVNQLREKNRQKEQESKEE